MTERFLCRFFCNFLLGCSPLYPRAFTMSSSQVCAAGWFCSGAKRAGQYDSVWSFKPYALCLHIPLWPPSCSQTISFSIQDLVPIGHIYTYLYIFVGAATSIAKGFGILDKTFVTAVSEIFWHLSKISRVHHSLCWDRGPKVNLIITKNVPSLKCEIWTGASIFAFFLVSPWAKQRRLSINWN